jgi:hypothetical protein
MLIRTSAFVFAAAAAVEVVFALTPSAGARSMHQCGAKYQAAGKSGCGTIAAKARRPPQRGITLGIGDVVSVSIFEPLVGYSSLATPARDPATS